MAVELISQGSDLYMDAVDFRWSGEAGDGLTNSGLGRGAVDMETKLPTRSFCSWADGHVEVNRVFTVFTGTAPEETTAELGRRIRKVLPGCE